MLLHGQRNALVDVRDRLRLRAQVTQEHTVRLRALLRGLFVALQAFQGRLHVKAKEIIHSIAAARGQRAREHREEAPQALVSILLHVPAVLHLSEPWEALAQGHHELQWHNGVRRGLQLVRHALELRGEHGVNVTALRGRRLEAFDRLPEVRDVAQALERCVHVASVPQVLDAGRENLHLLLLQDPGLLLRRQVLLEHNLLRRCLQLTTLGRAHERDLGSGLQLRDLGRQVVAILQHAPGEAKVLLPVHRDLRERPHLGLEHLHGGASLYRHIEFLLAPLELDRRHRF
mmetsp:Transcript_87606/g.225689  ORF Transcript_87606/g.225689 Transcript_87606/m.225689 type:complete len:288 (+) Transcript_87606:825-1688(+)